MANDIDNLLKRIERSPMWKLIQMGAILITYIIFYDPIKTWIFNLPVTFQTGLIIISFIIILVSLYSKYFISKVPIYSRRDNFMEDDLITHIKNAKSIKISNISFSIFRHIDDLPKIILTKIQDGGDFEILFTRRIRNIDDISYLGIREDDESNHELIYKTNKTLFEMFLFMLFNIYQLVDMIHPIPSGSSTAEKEQILNFRKNLFRKFQIKEYPFYPVMCMYMFDNNDLIFGPYIADECNRIPLFHLKKRVLRIGGKNLFGSDISGAYRQLSHHYDILSNPSQRNDKIALYLDQFCYYDGHENISVHEFIEMNYKYITKILNDKQLINKYENYLLGETNEFDDQISKSLGEHSAEGRFDSIMRDIRNKIDAEPHISQ